MLRTLILILLLSVARFGYSQTDTVRVSIFDSLNNLANLQWVEDSLTLISWADSLKTKVYNRFNVDSIRLMSKIDSLKSLRLSPESYISRFDSLLLSKQSKFIEIGEKQQELASKSKAKVDQWRQTVRNRLDSLGIKGSLPESIQSVKIPGAEELTLPGLDLPEVPALSPGDFDNMNLSPDLSKLNAELPFVSMDGLKGIQENFNGFGEKVAGISDLSSNPDQFAESVVGRIDAFNEVKEQTKALEELKPPANPLEQLPEANPEEIKEVAAEQTIDHFSGKEEPLNQALEKVSLYKQKYSNVKSIKELPKKMPNPMKDRPFIERLLPGLGIQIQQRNDYWVDFNPYVGYRFTSRLTSGLGWNQRIAFNLDKKSFEKQSRIYGPRIYGEFDLWRGFCPRIEIETMNTMIPPLAQVPQTDLGSRDWVWSYFAGMKKSYRISKRIKGTAMVMFNLYNPHYKSPYVDRVNMRIGFEFPLKKKKLANANKISKSV